MRSIFFRVFGFLVVVACFLQACRKFSKVDSSDMVKGLDGVWIAKGHGCATERTTCCGEVFLSFKVTVLDNSTVIARLGDTLKKTSVDEDRNEVVFSYSVSTYKHSASEALTYNYQTRTISDVCRSQNISSFSSVAIETYLVAPANKLSAVVTNNIGDIVGKKVLSGVAHDTLVIRAPRDSTYVISDTVEFTALNDSTILCAKDYFLINEKELHFKEVDETAKTITFQAFHQPYWFSNAAITLTYNYQTKAIILEQRRPDPFYCGYVKMQ
ncbi:MAG: hypothetical protein V4649_00210 [Bacteroidota bacterium]